MQYSTHLPIYSHPAHGNTLAHGNVQVERRFLTVIKLLLFGTHQAKPIRIIIIKSRKKEKEAEKRRPEQQVEDSNSGKRKS